MEEVVESSVTCVRVKTNAASHRVEHRLRLLKDLFLHEGVKVTCNDEMSEHQILPAKLKVVEYFGQQRACKHTSAYVLYMHIHFLVYILTIFCQAKLFVQSENK